MKKALPRLCNPELVLNKNWSYFFVHCDFSSEATNNADSKHLFCKIKFQQWRMFTLKK
jgi:hypothetical protein